MAGAIAGKQGMSKPVAEGPEWKRLLSKTEQESVNRVFQDERIAPILESIRKNAPHIYEGLQDHVLMETNFTGFPAEVFDELMGKDQQRVMRSQMTKALDERVLGILRQPGVRDGLVGAMHTSGMAKGTAEVVVDEFLKTGVMAQHVYARAERQLYPEAEKEGRRPVDRFIEKRDSKATEALMRAVLEQVKWIPYEGKQVSVKELAQLAYFGSTLKKEVTLEYLTPDQFSALWSDVYKSAVEGGRINPAATSLEAYLATRVGVTMSTIMVEEGGKESHSIVVNGSLEGVMTISYVLSTYMHETGHVRIPRGTEGRGELQNVILEGICEDIPRVGLEEMEKAFPKVPFEACGWIAGHHVSGAVYVFGRVFAGTLRDISGVELYQKLILPGLQLVATEGGEKEFAHFLKIADERIGAEKRG